MRCLLTLPPNTHTLFSLQNAGSPLFTSFSGFLPQTTLLLPPVGNNASCLQVDLFARSQRCGWSHLREAGWEAGLGCGCGEQVASACFRTSLLLPADSDNGLRLHILAEEDLSGHAGCVPGGLAELSGGFPSLAWVPGPGERMCSLPSTQCATLCQIISPPRSLLVSSVKWVS